MNAPLTSRRAMLKGAAMLTAVPVAALGGVSIFDAGHILPVVPDLTTFEGRLLAAVDWLGLPPPPLTYDEEDPRGGVLFTSELGAWFKETDFTPHLRWVFDGDPTGASVEQQRRRLLQDQECLDLFKGLDKTEQGVMLEALERLADKSMPPEVILAEGRAKLAAHRAAKVMQ